MLAAPGVQPSRARQSLLVGVVSGVLGLGFLWLAYWHFGFRSVMGDDLDLLVRARTPGGYASDFWRSFTQTGGEKFRPGVTPVLSLMTHGLGGDFTAWRVVTLVLFSLDGALVGVLAWRLSRSYVLAGLTVLAALFSRFASYFALQGYGVMESLAMLWVLVALLCVQTAWERRSPRLLTAASLGYLLALFTHERFIVLAPFLVTVALLAPWPLSRARRLGIAVLPLAVAALNYAVKTWVLHIDFFTSGGSANATSPGGIARFVVSAALNTVGYNEGPTYLSGNDAHSLGARGILIAFALFVPLVALAGVHARAHLWHARPAAFVPLAIGTSLYLPLLLSASIQTRQEYRWLYAPFVVLVLGVAWVAGQLPRGSRLAWLPLLALVGSLTVDATYRHWLPNTYYFAGQETADSVRSVVIDAHRTELADSTVILIGNDEVFRTWYMGSGSFFDIYAPGHGPVLFAKSDVEARAMAAAATHPLAFLFQTDHVVAVTL